MEAWKPVVKEIVPSKEPIVTVAPTKTANWSSILQGKDVNPPPQAFATAPSPTTSHTEPANSTSHSHASPFHQVLASTIPLPTATPTIPAVAKKVEEILDEIKTQDRSFSSVDEPERAPKNVSSKPTPARHIVMNPIFDDDFDRPASQEEEEDYPEWADAELPPVEFSFDSNNYFGQPSIISPPGVIGQSKATTQQQPPSPTSLYSPPFFSQSPENTTFFPSHSPPASSGTSSRFGGPSLFSFLPSPPPPPENSTSYLLQPHATYHNPLFGGGGNTDSPVSPAAANISPPYLSSFSRTPGPSRPKQTSPSAGQYQLF